jgi:hypothetical protein
MPFAYVNLLIFSSITSSINSIVDRNFRLLLLPIYRSTLLRVTLRLISCRKRRLGRREKRCRPQQCERSETGPIWGRDKDSSALNNGRRPSGCERREKERTTENQRFGMARC